MYSDVCEVMFSQLDTRDLDNGVPYGVIRLENNIIMIKDVALSKNCSHSVSIGLIKLQDHISLEIRRMRYMAVQNKHQKDTAEQLASNLNNQINTSIKQAKSNFDSQIQQTKDSVQKNHITILGIFAAIVIAFASTWAFSSSILQNMANVSIYRLSFTMLVLGFLAFNMLCALFMFLGKIANFKVLNKSFIIGIDTTLVVFIVLTFSARCFHFLG